MILQWHVTERCDRCCAHCYQDGVPTPELDARSMRAVLEQFRHLLLRRAGTEGFRRRGLVTLTGGEPFVRSDFEAFVEHLAGERSWTRFAILTHGGPVDDRRARWLASLVPAFVQVSLDGGEATHERIRGDGSFASAVAGIRRLVRAGVRTSISFTAHRGNFRELPDVVAVARKLGAHRVWTDRLVPFGRGADLESLRPDETREYLRTLRRERRRSTFRRTKVSTRRALQFLAGGGRPYRCSAGDTLLTVLPDGTVLPCRRLPLVVGNVMETPLARLFEESEELRRLRDRSRRPAGCETCEHVDACGGGLRCLAHALNDSPFDADPGCPLAKDLAEPMPCAASRAVSRSIP